MFFTHYNNFKRLKYNYFHKIKIRITLTVPPEWHFTT